MTTKQTSIRRTRQVLLGSAALSLLLGMPVLLAPQGLGVAQAQTSGSGSGHKGPGASGSGMGQGGQSGVRGHEGQGGSTGEETGDTTDSDKKGPRFGGGTNTSKPAPGTTGGRPVWAKEGIPAVELGRLSVARAPAHVIDKAAA